MHVLCFAVKLRETYFLKFYVKLETIVMYLVNRCTAGFIEYGN